MRRYLAISAATIALAVPSIAAAGTPGFVDVSLGTIDVDPVELSTIGVGGAVVAPLSGNWHVQFDGKVTRYEDGDVALNGSGFSAHVFHDGGDWAVGALLGYQSLSSAAFWTLGAEAQYSVGAFVLEGGLGIGTAEDPAENLDTFSANASATWYANPDLSFTGGISYFDLDDEFDATSYSIDAEYRFAGSPFSVIGGYTFTDYEGSAEGDTWSIGLRYGFGDATLQARRNDGPRWLREDSAVLQ